VWGRVRAEGLVEWFNLFNRRNYDPTQYGKDISATTWGQPGRATALPYQSRQLQLGFRTTF
jgi:hypothetical protein